MKKFTSIILGCAILCLTACSNNSQQSVAENSIDDNTTISNQENSVNDVDDNTSNNVQSETSKESEFIKVNKNSKLTMSDGTDEIEFTLTDVCFQNEVHSNSTNPFASYFPDKDGESYIVAKITIKNIGGNSTGYYFFDDIQVTFGGKYNYTLQELDLESSVMSKYWSCAPLKTVEIYWVQSVSDEVKSMGCNISFKVGDDLYKY